jgi:hypothetical protein
MAGRVPVKLTSTTAPMTCEMRPVAPATLTAVWPEPALGAGALLAALGAAAFFTGALAAAAFGAAAALGAAVFFGAVAMMMSSMFLILKLEADGLGNCVLLRDACCIAFRIKFSFGGKYAANFIAKVSRSVAGNYSAFINCAAFIDI